jgi:hypothetical protein
MPRHQGHRRWLVRSLLAAAMGIALSTGVLPGLASAAPAESAATEGPAGATPDEPAVVSGPTTDAADTASDSGTQPDNSPESPDPKPSSSIGSDGAAQQARDEAAAAQKARDQAADRQAKAQALAEKRAAQAARAAQRARASWDGHGQPARMIIFKQRSIDLVTNGRLTRQVPRSGGALTLPTLQRFVPREWLRITDGTAELTAAIVLTPGQTLTLGNGDVRAVRLAGGPSPSDAASIYTGQGRLILRGVTVSSFDPASGQAMPVGRGRPFLVVSRGGHFEAVDSAINDLGTVPTDPGARAGLGLGETSTGSLVRTSLARNSIGIKLDRTDGVRLDGVAVTESVDDGLVLRGDRGTVLTGVSANGNGGNGVLVVGPSSERPITGISAAENKLFGVALTGQNKPQVNGITTAKNTVGGLRVSWSTEVTVNDLSSTEDAMGIYTHVGSSHITVNRAHITDPRRGFQVEKTTRDLTANASTISGATIAGIAIGGQRVTLNDVAIADSAAALRIERGAGDVAATGLTLTGGSDGIVALSATKNVTFHRLATDGVTRTAVRTFSPGLQIVNSRITGSATGIDAGAATTIANTTIDDADEGIRSRSSELVDVDDAIVSALSVGVNAAPGSPVQLAGSHIDALEALRGVIDQDGVNDLSLPPLNVLGAIGVPLILLALILEQVQIFRTRSIGSSRRRTPPALPSGTA